MKKSFMLLIVLFGLLITVVYSNIERSSPKQTANVHIEEVEEFSLPVEKQKQFLEYFKTAQVSIYECEAGNDSNTLKFGTHETGSDYIDYSIFKKGKTVRYCSAEKDKKGYVVKDITYNTKLLDLDNSLSVYNSESVWYISPSMRIDKDIIMSSPHLRVCRIEVLDCKGEIAKAFEITAKDFMDINREPVDGLYYHGEYKHDFDHIEGTGMLIYEQRIMNPTRILEKNCKTDLRIYWLGKCDMWIDYVKIENQTGRRVLEGKYDMYIDAMTGIDLSELNMPVNDIHRKIPSEYILKRISSNYSKRGKNISNALYQNR